MLDSPVHKLNLKGVYNMIKKYKMNFPDGARIKYVINLILFTFTVVRFIKY